MPADCHAILGGTVMNRPVHAAAVAVLLFLALCTGTAAGDELAADSHIDRVTLYPGGLARIERTASIPAAAARGTLVFADLPATLESDSVRLAVEAGSARLSAVAVERTAVSVTDRARERELRDRIEALEAERRQARDGVEVARTQLRFIEGLAALPQAEDAAEALAGGDAAERWDRLWERIGAGAGEARARIRAGEREAARLGEDIEALERRLEQLGTGERETIVVRAPFRATGDEAVDVRLSYRVRGPVWQPTYDSRLDTANGRLRLVRGAEVRQATGEDWRDVRLSLATARPVSGERPDPAPWWIDLAPEQQRAGADADAEQALMTDAAPERARGARLVDAEFAATYAVDGRVTVPGDNQPRTLELATDELAADVRARVFAQRDSRAWLTADATWTGDGPLPAGPVARFRDGAYVGTGHLPSWAPGQAHDLSFGTDPRIEVNFRPQRDEAGESGWINTRRTLARSYRLEITNRHDRALTVDALFRVPVARNEAIEVEAEFAREPDRRDIDDRPGVHAWRLDLAADETASLDLGYRVRYPEDRELSGL